VKAVAETLGVARSSLIKQLAQRPGSGGTYAKAGDAVLLIPVCGGWSMRGQPAAIGVSRP
jgi:hypothetical protein